ncbi:hypothetical protein [Roseobacter sp. N2S]|uniref:hypothetical protein n=1 Tax=Roseobacter sp. N2S TaxID=2663844 RepID=UPI0028673488|nr:hypothetical protein [Roseobacter sp. N2S]MDR6264212.1 hypothetical protein [Roseobacter sp. N2S]
MAEPQIPDRASSMGRLPLNRSGQLGGGDTSTAAPFGHWKQQWMITFEECAGGVRTLPVILCGTTRLDDLHIAAQVALDRQHGIGDCTLISLALHCGGDPEAPAATARAA